MKRTAILLSAFSLLMISCKETKNENHAADETITTETSSHETHTESANELNNDWVDDIVLNNGVKWQANKETTDGVRAMLSLITKSQASTIEDYNELGDKLNGVKNTVVKECTMKGPSHDNLHVWLYPLDQKIELLQKTETDKEGAETLAVIIDNLNAYTTYFK